jgi:cytidylate kinase
MSVITISRGTFSGGKAIADCLSRRLGYRCIDRDMIVQKAAVPNATPEELRAALEQPPGILDRFRHKRYLYLALVQAALTAEVRHGRAIYHGLGGHLLLGGVDGILRLRIIAPMEFRIRMARERNQFDRAEAIAYIEKADRDRRKWTQFLYGVDWADPALYDFVISLEHLTAEQACAMVAPMLEAPCFELTEERQAALASLALASRVRADLALDPATAHLELQVEASGGAVTVEGDLGGQMEAVQRIGMAVEGVTRLTVRQVEGSAVLPWLSLSRRD